ncbi:MAG: zinc-ribbon domain-containing protein [Pseudomonadota bacterium]
MEVICENCSTKLNIPDEKIPEGQKVRISCPKCKQKITIGKRTPASEEEYAETGKFHLKFLEKKSQEPPEGEGYSYDDYSDDKSLDVFEEGTSLALVLDSDEARLEKIRAAVKNLGYQFVTSANTRDATGKLRFYNFDLIILTDGFDGQNFDQSPILNFLNRLSMSVRRRIFVALMGEEFKTLDNMMAFAKSANAVINIREVDKLSGILKRAVAENEKFYKVYMDILAEVGKA